jgi:glycosyltransferase involved in cell wall biosynthesis
MARQGPLPLGSMRATDAFHGHAVDSTMVQRGPGRSGSGRPMRVLYVIDSLVPSGAERSLAEMLPVLTAHGVDPMVAYLRRRPGLQEDVLQAGAALVCLEGSGGRWGSVRRIRAVIRGWNPALIHTTLAEADLAGRTAGRLEHVPVISSLVNDQFGPWQRRASGIPAWKLEIARAVDALTARWVVRFHAITDHVADVMSRRLGVPRHRIDVIPRGRDPDRLGTRSARRARATRTQLGVNRDAFLILAVARHERQKGLDVLLRALPRVLQTHPSAVLAVAGREGNETPALRAITERLGLGHAVRLLGLRHDVPDLLCAADVFAFPSYWEGLGSVLLEAMALEAPIVASDLPAVREVVAEGETAHLVPVGDADTLGRALVETLGDRHGAAARAGAARARFLERFTVGRVGEQMVELYRRALS